MIVKRIISGGQTGGDQAGLEAAEALGLETGGWLPHGCRTQAGPRWDLLERYGMREHPSPKYPPRTEANVIDSDATMIFGDAGSPGCSLTARLCTKHRRPFYLQRWRPGDTIGVREIDAFVRWLSVIPGTVLNVAGNREESQPGIKAACRAFIIHALSRQPGGR